MSQNWKIYRVEDIAEPVKGSVVTGPFGSSIGRKYWQESGVPVIRGNNIVFDGPDFVDENLKQLFWQAVCESSYSPNRIPKEREAQLRAIVDKVFLGYPPKK